MTLCVGTSMFLQLTTLVVHMHTYNILSLIFLIPLVNRIIFSGFSTHFGEILCSLVSSDYPLYICDTGDSCELAPTCTMKGMDQAAASRMAEILHVPKLPSV